MTDVNEQLDAWWEQKRREVEAGMTPERRAEIRQKAFDTLESAGETLKALQARAERRAWEGSDQAVHRQPEPRPLPQRPARARPRDWGERQAMDPEASANWNRWGATVAEQAFDRKIGPYAEKLCESIGQAVAEIMNKERREMHEKLEALRGELAKSDAAVTELLMEQERRLAALAALESRLAEAEQRAAPATPAPMRRVA